MCFIPCAPRTFRAQAEILEGIETDIAGAVGWMGAYNASTCTTEQVGWGDGDGCSYSRTCPAMTR